MKLVSRPAHIDSATSPPMRFLVAEGCPKLLEGHKFYACRCYGPEVPKQQKPSILVTCEFVKGIASTATKTSHIVTCGYGGAPNPGSGVQFGTPTVAHVVDDSDGGYPD